MLREQTTGGLTDIRETELISFDIFNPMKLNDNDLNKLKNLFELLGKSEFPSIHEQYISGFELKYRLDSTILEILGFNPGEIRNTLDKLYKAIADELERKD
jgi:hypothetical protein